MFFQPKGADRDAHKAELGYRPLGFFARGIDVLKGDEAHGF